MNNLAHISDHERFEGREAPQKPKGAQLEDGYVRTANEIVEALMRAPLTSRENRIIRAIERATYGWQRSSARLSQSVLAKMTGMTPKRCSEALNSLIRKRVVIRDGGGRSPVMINTSVSEWDFSDAKDRVTPKQQQAPKRGHRPQDGDVERPQGGDTDKERKDSLVPKGTKESSKKSAPRKWGEEVDHELVTEMVAAVSADLDAPIKHSPTTWANEFRLMRERDGRTVEQIRYLITWTAQHEFWSGVVLSPKKLRDKWDQLAKQVKSQKKPKSHPDGRKGFAQPKPAGDYEDNNEVPAWMEDLS